MEKNKLREIQKELIICEKPSSYLEEIKDSLRNTPLDALLILQNTEQNLKYHPEGNVWNHVMQVIDTAAKVKEDLNDMILLFISDRLGRGQLEDNKKAKEIEDIKKVISILEENYNLDLKNIKEKVKKIEKII